MRYWVQVGERTFEVAVRAGEERITARVEGRDLEVQLEAGGPGQYTLLVDGRPYDLAAAPQGAGYTVLVQGVPFDVVVQDERQRQLSALEPSKTKVEGQAGIRAPMPGRVTLVDVTEGESVENGKRLVVLEAMKMENDITAPRPGRVVHVKVSKGQTVEQGQLLVVLE